MCSSELHGTETAVVICNEVEQVAMEAVDNVRLDHLATYALDRCQAVLVFAGHV